MSPVGSKMNPPKDTPKKRKMCAAQIEQSLTNTMVSQKDRDISYVTEVLHDSGAQLSQYLAGLLRDGVIQRAMERAQAPVTPVELGKPLPAKLRRYACLPPKFKLALVVRLNKALRDMTAPDAQEASVDGEVASDLASGSGDGRASAGSGVACELSEGVLDAAIAFALNKDLETPIPQGHLGARFENPLLDVLAERAHAMGDRLENVSVEDLQSMSFGHFTWDRKTPNKVMALSGQSVKISLSAEMLTEMPDLQIADNWSFQAALISASTGYRQSLHMLLKTQFQHVFPDPQAGFEYPAAAEKYKGMVKENPEPQETSSKLKRSKAEGDKNVAERVAPTVARPKRRSTTPVT